MNIAPFVEGLDITEVVDLLNGIDRKLDLILEQRATDAQLAGLSERIATKAGQLRSAVEANTV